MKGAGHAQSTTRPLQLDLVFALNAIFSLRYENDREKVVLGI